MSGVIGLGVLVLAFLVTVIHLPPPLPDLRRVGFVATILVGTIDAILYWMIISLVAWRRLKVPDRPVRTAPHALSTARVIPDDHLGKGAFTTARRAAPPLTPSIALSPAEFEQEVAWVFGKLSGLQAEVVGKSNDGGIDVKVYDATGTLVAIMQAKRYTEQKALNPGFLRELDSCKRRMGVPRAYLVTTARFSDEVLQQAQEMHIDLVDGQLFEDWRQKAYARTNERAR